MGETYSKGHVTLSTIAKAEAVLGRIVAQIERPIRAVDRGLMERRKSFIFLAGFLRLLRLFFDSYIAWLPWSFLLWCTGHAIRRRLKTHPRPRMVLLMLGFFVGTFINDDLGFH